MDYNCCWSGLSWDSTNYTESFDISSIPSNALVSSVTFDTSALNTSWTSYGSSSTLCNQATNWSASPGGASGDMQAIPGRLTLNWSVSFALGWYADDSVYGCRGGASGNVNLNVDYTAPIPVITSVSPTAVPRGGTITITGSHFGNIMPPNDPFNPSVYAGNWGATIISWSDTQIVAQLSSIADSSNVYVAVPAVSNAVPLLVLGSQTITALSPASGPVGASVTITGSGFGTTLDGMVEFNGTIAVPTSWSDTSITVPVPSGASTGPVVVLIYGLSSYPVVFTVTQVSITVTTNPPGRSITVDSTAYT